MKKYVWSEESTKIIEDFWEDPFEQKSRELIASEIGLINGTLTEIGCGSGRQGILIPCDEYIGIDGSSAMLHIASKRFIVNSKCPFSFQLADASNTHRENRKSGTVLCTQVLRHNDEWRPLVDEMLRICTNKVILVDAFSADKTKLGVFEGAGGVWPDNQWSYKDIVGSYPSWNWSFQYVAGIEPVGIIELWRKGDGTNTII